MLRCLPRLRLTASHSRVLTIPALRTIRPAIHFSPPPPTPRRAFTSTQPKQASEDPIISAFKNTSLFRKLADKPEALHALENFAKLLQEAGVDLSSGKPPSTLQMMKLAANTRFRESAQKVADELRKAGVDFQSKELMAEIMSLKNKPPGSNEPKS
ncbi:hypothetical protein BDN72DRAFT_891952 [Pluteus cervinus]|uniref:Uncharacterized protein n=1 Tax=Pluteus cervinus TaxID=181527 RepID=A0ACD3BDL1_9AGAR|nr:hypothetical protein BDN72DRAFT_891952 [Pluteus cervinus]